MHTPEISIIMPAYNNAAWLGQAVESVLLQDGPSWELLVIDDGSSDGTQDLAQSYAQRDTRIRALANERGKGAAGARNTGLAAARGKHIFFLDSDDVLYPGALAALHAALAQSGAAAARGRHDTFCQQRWLVGERCHRNRAGTLEVPLGAFWEHLFQADFLREHGIVFLEGALVGEDTAFVCHAYAHMIEPPALIDAPLLLYRFNHKAQAPAIQKSTAFLDYAFFVAGCFKEHGKEDWIAPFVQLHILPGWLFHLYAARQAGQEQALDFTRRCLALFDLAGVDPQTLSAALPGPAAEAFTALPGKADAAATLLLLERHGLIQPPSYYAGIPQSPTEPGWRAYRISRRIGNLLRSGATRRALRYLKTLKRRSERRTAPGEQRRPLQGRRYARP